MSLVSSCYGITVLPLDFAMNCGMHLHYVSVRWIAAIEDIRHICYRLVVLEGIFFWIKPCLQCTCRIWNMVANLSFVSVTSWNMGIWGKIQKDQIFCEFGIAANEWLCRNLIWKKNLMHRLQNGSHFVLASISLMQCVWVSYCVSHPGNRRSHW